MVEWGGLENRWALTSPQGSNPCLSAILYCFEVDVEIAEVSNFAVSIFSFLSLAKFAFLTVEDLTESSI